MSLAVGQMTYNGVQIGPGGIAALTNVSGLTGLPTSRNGDVSRPNAHGMLGGYDFMGTRTVTMNLEVVPSATAFMPVNLDTLRAAMLIDTVATGGVNPNSAQVLTFNLGEGNGGVGVNKRIACRPRKFDAPVDITFAAGGFQKGLAKVAVQLDAIDPLIYDAVTQTASVGLTAISGGFTFPASFPATFGTQSGGMIYATNSGTIAGPVYMSVTGPCTNPRIEQQTTGVTLAFNLTLNAGDTLVIDSFYGSAVLNNSVSRTNTLKPGSFISTFNLPPGTNTIGFYSSDASPTGSMLTVDWSNTWA